MHNNVQRYCTNYTHTATNLSVHVYLYYLYLLISHIPSRPNITPSTNYWLFPHSRGMQTKAGGVPAYLAM